MFFLHCFIFCWSCKWEKYQTENDAALGRGKRQKKAVSYWDAYASYPSEILSEICHLFLVKNDFAKAVKSVLVIFVHKKPLNRMSMYVTL
ncbi:hypothetical protein ACSBR2_013860 [Camellia fascicularis]